ncbi:hypothetical protein ACSVDE_01520 [Pseudalkalibacillus sp. Hm43]|uniref:hypothetical protein n=1 Tax=Pseudalkalibacillus sp. Hm43 TaxID=3450742 RepID=UPI003F431B94
MWKIIGLLLVSAAIVLIEYPQLKKNRSRMDRWSFAVLLGIASMLSIMKIYDVPLFNPLQAIEFIYKPIYEIVFNRVL